MRSRKSISIFYLLALLLVFTLSCKAVSLPINFGEDTHSPRLTPYVVGTPDANFIYDGHWEGTTTQQLRITFTVKYSDIVTFSYKANFAGAGCTHSLENKMENKINPTMEALGYYVPVNPIEKGKFEIITDNAGITNIFAGTFKSPTSVSGMIEYVITGGSCNGKIKVDWTATKTTQ